MNQTCLQAVIHTSSSISKQDLPNCCCRRRRKLRIKTTKFSFAFCLWPPPPLPLCSTWNFRNFQTKHSVWKSRKKVSNYKIRTFNFDYKIIWIFISGDIWALFGGKIQIFTKLATISNIIFGVKIQMRHIWWFSTKV